MENEEKIVHSDDIFIDPETGEIFDGTEANEKIDFFAAAQDALSDCPLFVGRTQLKTDDIIGKELTLIGFDYAIKRKDVVVDGVKTKQPIISSITGKPEKYGVGIFAEYPDKYYSAGTVGTKLFDSLCRTAKSGAVKTSVMLAASGGIVIRFTKPSGKQYISVEPIRRGSYKG